MYKNQRSFIGLAITTSIALTLPACMTTTGTARVASIGIDSTPTKENPDASDTPKSPEPEKTNRADRNTQSPETSSSNATAQSASTTQSSRSGSSDGGLSLGKAGALATGGLVGENGIAGMGLLRNTGKPGEAPLILANVQTSSGRTVNMVANEGMKVAAIADQITPASLSLSGTVIGVIAETGQTLVQSGKGEVYLIDGLLATPGTLATITIGEAYLIGSPEAQPFIGASILSPKHTTGRGLTVSVLSGGSFVTLRPENDLMRDSIEQSGGGLTGVLDHATQAGGIMPVNSVGGALTVSEDILHSTDSTIPYEDLTNALGSVLGEQPTISAPSLPGENTPLTNGDDGLLSGAPIVGGDGGILEDVPILNDVNNNDGLLGGGLVGDDSLLGDSGLIGDDGVAGEGGLLGEDGLVDVVEDTADDLLGGSCSAVGGLLGGNC
ncbi:hypothetical protein [Hyphococcus lacteus]|uniref:FecR protein domain-containing protein n=1 Tax=Hyphococcus lacteus TaxID=3143536 RepID=A0ABV3Z165_9PROT